MRHIPIDACVECSDGKVGRSLAVIINPTTRQLTNVVVEDQTSSEAMPRLVPIDKLAEVAAGRIKLNCRRADLAHCEPFVERRFLHAEVPDYRGTQSQMSTVYAYPYVVPHTQVNLQIDTHMVPAGELAIHRGFRVRASDGEIGHVSELLVDPDSQGVSHLVVRGRHFLGRHDLTLPLSAIERVERETVWLKLDRHTVAGLPTIPFRRRYASQGRQLSMVAKIFEHADGAAETLKFVRQLHGEGIIKLRNAAVLVKDVDGRARIHETADLDAPRGAIFGAITGGLIGLLGGPIGAVVGAVAGAGTGGIAADRIDTGFPNNYLRQFQARLQPGGSALIVLVEHEWSKHIAELLGTIEGVLLQHELTDEAIGRLIVDTQQRRVEPDAESQPHTVTHAPDTDG